MIKKLVVCLACLISINNLIQGTEYYIDVNSRGGPASDDNPGTEKAPWKTLKRINGKNGVLPQAGDTVWVRAGEYNETLNLEAGGTKDKPLIMKAYSGERPVIDGKQKRHYGIKIFPAGNADNVVIEGFILRNFIPSGGAAAIYVKERKGVVIRNVEIANAFSGVVFYSAGDCSLLNSKIHDCHRNNVSVRQGCVNIKIAGNHVYRSLSRKGDCITVSSPADGLVATGIAAKVEEHAPGIAKLSSEDINFTKLKRSYKLKGRSVAGGKTNLNYLLLFDGELTPTIRKKRSLPGNKKEIQGGTAILRDGRKWFVLRNNPEWGNKPYSPDGKSLLFETGNGVMEKLAKATFFYLSYKFNQSDWPKDIQILNNRVEYSARQGILVTAADGVLVKNNVIHHSGATGIQIETSARNLWIDGNTSYANCITHAGETGIWLSQNINVVIQNNIIKENRTGLMLQQSHWILIRRNLIYNNKAQHLTVNAEAGRRNSGGLQIRGGKHGIIGAPHGATHIGVLHNTFYNNGADVSFWGNLQHGVPGFTQASVGRNIILNNLVQDGGGKALLYIYKVLPLVCNGNIYNGNSASANVTYVPPEAKIWSKDYKVYPISIPEDFIKYKKTLVMDQKSLYAEVKFADPKKDDFKLLKDSVGIGKAVPLALTLEKASGKKVAVDRIECFSDGFRKQTTGEVLIPGDLITIGSKKTRILDIDREKRQLELEGKIDCEKGTEIYYYDNGSVKTAGAFIREGK